MTSLGPPRPPTPHHGPPRPPASPPKPGTPCPTHPQPRWALTLVLVLEELLGAELEDVIKLLLGHGAGLGAQPRAHDQVGQHHLALGHLRDAFLHRSAGDKPVDHHLVGLADAVRPAEGLRGRGRVSGDTAVGEGMGGGG